MRSLLFLSLFLAVPAFAQHRGGGGHVGGGHVGGGHVGGGHVGGGHVSGGHYGGGHYTGGHVGGFGRGYSGGPHWSGHWGGRAYYAPRPYYYGRAYHPAWSYWGPRWRVVFNTPAWYGGHWYHGYIGPTFGWWWGVGGLWYYYPVPVYPYPVEQPTAADEAPPMLYYCRSAGQYYPQVRSCNEQWEQVPAQPQQPPPQQQQPQYVPQQPAPNPQTAPQYVPTP